ncbi:MAG: hypothetical protein NC118_03555 [Eubacterium sp.]|nr:hypothetical protein [Eubacterium sp.]
MKYFILKTAKEYRHNPQIKLPYDEKEKIFISKGNYNIIRPKSIWTVVEKDMTYFADILIEPVLLLKEIAKNTLQIYDPRIQFKQIILQMDKSNMVELYYLPLLETIKGVSEENNRIRIEQSFLLTRNAMLMLQMESKKCILANIEIIEAFLKRRITGVEIQSIDIVNT